MPAALKTEPLKNTQEIQDEIKALHLNILRLKHQIKFSTNPMTKKTWVRSLNQLILEHNAKVKLYNTMTGKTARVVDRYLRAISDR